MLSVQLSGTFGRHVTDWKYTAVSEGSGSHDAAVTAPATSTVTAALSWGGSSTMRSEPPAGGHGAAPTVPAASADQSAAPASDAGVRKRQATALTVIALRN